MHRSGTSLIARTLNLLGLWLGPEDHLMPPIADNNPAGFWENSLLMAINDDILATLAGNWHELPRLAAGWEASPELAALRRRAAT